MNSGILHTHRLGMWHPLSHLGIHEFPFYFTSCSPKVISGTSTGQKGFHMHTHTHLSLSHTELKNILCFPFIKASLQCHFVQRNGFRVELIKYLVSLLSHPMNQDTKRVLERTVMGEHQTQLLNHIL